MDIITEDFGKNLVIEIGGETVTLRIFNMSNDQIKFGIDAPSGLSIHREEIYKLIQEKDKA